VYLSRDERALSLLVAVALPFSYGEIIYAERGGKIEEKRGRWSWGRGRMGVNMI
jgi:hypothetical protein